MFPVDAHTTPRRAASSAFETATAIPRSLNEPGRVRALPLEPDVEAEPLREPVGAASSGVEPSPSVTSGVPVRSGSDSR